MRAPAEDEGLWVCTLGQCPSFDGKRCRETGNEPDRLCEPEVRYRLGIQTRPEHSRLLGYGRITVEDIRAAEERLERANQPDIAKVLGDVAVQAVRLVIAQQEKIIRGFVAETGLLPSECMQIVKQEFSEEFSGFKFWVQPREEETEQQVRDAERDRCARVCESMVPTNHTWSRDEALVAEALIVAAAEIRKGGRRGEEAKEQAEGEVLPPTAEAEDAVRGSDEDR